MCPTRRNDCIGISDSREIPFSEIFGVADQFKQAFIGPDSFVFATLSSTRENEFMRHTFVFPDPCGALLKVARDGHGIDHFVWHQFCDWYIEAVKPDFFDRDSGRQRVSRSVLLEVLGTLLRLLHPITPSITEELWQKLPGTEGHIAVAQSPGPSPTPPTGTWPVSTARM